MTKTATKIATVYTAGTPAASFAAGQVIRALEDGERAPAARVRTVLAAYERMTAGEIALAQGTTMFRQAMDRLATTAIAA